MSTRTVTLEVTKDDIKNGKRGNPRYCPIALALKRALPDAEAVRVAFVTDVQFADSKCWMTASDRMRLFIGDFDNPSRIPFVGRFLSSAKPFTEEITFNCRPYNKSADDEGDAELTH